MKEKLCGERRFLGLKNPENPRASGGSASLDPVTTLGSGVATEVARGGGKLPPLTAKKLPKIGKIRKNREKFRKNRAKKRKYREEKAKIGKFLSLFPSWQPYLSGGEVSFTFPLLTDRAGYATATRDPWAGPLDPTPLIKTLCSLRSTWKLIWEKVHFKSQILVHEYWTILSHFCIPVLLASG